MKKIQTKQFLVALSIVVLLAVVGAVIFASFKYDLKFSVGQKRSRRNAVQQNEFVFNNKLHKVHWSKSPFQKKILKRSVREDLLDDIFISVKTSGKFHESRLDPILKTWFKLAEKQVEIHAKISQINKFF